MGHCRRALSGNSTRSCDILQLYPKISTHGYGEVLEISAFISHKIADRKQQKRTKNGRRPPTGVVRMPQIMSSLREAAQISKVRETLPSASRQSHDGGQLELGK